MFQDNPKPAKNIQLIAVFYLLLFICTCVYLTYVEITLLEKFFVVFRKNVDSNI